MTQQQQQRRPTTPLEQRPIYVHQNIGGPLILTITHVSIVER